MTTYLQQGVHQISAERYHADNLAELPSLSHSIIKVLLRQSPRHAKHLHPRLSGKLPDDSPTQAKEEGVILHKLILGTGAPVVEVAADDWKQKTDQRRRAEARASGHIPVLSWRLAELHECAEAIIEQMMEIEACADFFDPDCLSAATLLWQLGPLPCRAMVDRMAPNGVWFDLKSSGISAHPDVFGRTMEREHATQACWYRSGGVALHDAGANGNGSLDA